MAFDINKIEERIDKVVTGSIELSDEGGGISIKRLVDAMEVAKMMAISGPAVPQFMQGQPGICYAAVVRAVRWNFDPFFVAEMMYLTKSPSGDEKIAFMAQLINAVINAHAPLQKKLWGTYVGEGQEMKLTVYGLPRGQTEVLDYETPTIGQLIKIRGRNQYGNVKGSPLYDNDPKQQLWYYGTRSFCRRHFPEVLAGIYDRDEFEPVDPKDVTPERPTLSQRLGKQKRIASARGFDAQHIERETQVRDGASPVPNDPTGVASGSETAPSAAPPSDPADGVVGDVQSEG